MDHRLEAFSIGIRDVVAGWLVCLAIAAAAIVALPDSSDSRPAAQAIARTEIFSPSANKPPAAPVSNAVRHC